MRPAGAGFVRCDESVGELVGYDFRDAAHPGAADGPGYYRRDDAPSADFYQVEYSREVLRRASAAGASFVACAERVMEIDGDEHRNGPDGLGYYRLGEGEQPVPGARPDEPTAPAGGGGDGGDGATADDDFAALLAMADSA